jgi:hypothetical protein
MLGGAPVLKPAASYSYIPRQAPESCSRRGWGTRLRRSAMASSKRWLGAIAGRSSARLLFRSGCFRTAAGRPPGEPRRQHSAATRFSVQVLRLRLALDGAVPIRSLCRAVSHRNLMPLNVRARALLRWGEQWGAHIMACQKWRFNWHFRRPCADQSSAITPYANSLSGSGRARKRSITAGFSRKAPDCRSGQRGLSGLSETVCLQSS